MSTELLVYLSPDQFLGMAYTLPESPHSIDNIVELASLMRGGTQMDDVPYLLINEFGRVTGHEGRHRANALRRMGYQKMPVRLMSNNFADIRWGQQSDPNNSNYKQRLPDVLISEEGYQAMEVPYETEGPRRGMPRPEYADSTPQKIPRPSFEWEGQFVRGWDYEARMLPELGSEEFHNAAHRTKIKVEARAMFDRVGAELSGFDKRMHDLRGAEAYEDKLYSLYREPQFRNIEVGFIEQARKADGQPFDIFWEDDRFDLGDLAEQEIYWNPTESKAEVAQAKEQILRDRAETRRHQEAYIEELEAKRLAEELEEQRMLATLTPQERAAYLKKKQDELFDDLILLQEQPQEPRMADDMVDVYGRKLTEEQALKELADLQEQFRVTAPDSRAYNELRGEIRLLDRALENYYTQVPATTDIFGDPVESRRPDPSDFLEDPVVTRTMETGLPEDFGPPRQMVVEGGNVRNIPPEYREAVRNPAPTVRGDPQAFIDAFDEMEAFDDELLMTMRQDPATREALGMYNERASEVRKIRQELAENPDNVVRMMLRESLERAEDYLSNIRMSLEQKASETQARRSLAAQQRNESLASAMQEPRIGARGTDADQTVVSTLREGQTEAVGGLLDIGERLEPSGARVINRAGTIYDQGPGAIRIDDPDPGPGRLRLSPKFTADAEQLRDILADPDTKARIAKGQLNRLQELTLRAAPALRAAGNVALAGELLYYIGKERSLPGGVMAAGAATVEGTGALLEAPSQILEATVPGYGEKGVHLGAELAGMAGRGIRSLVGAYGREQGRKERRKVYNEAIDYGTRVMGLSLDDARGFGQDYMKRYREAQERGVEPPPIGRDPLMSAEQDEALMSGMR